MQDIQNDNYINIKTNAQYGNTDAFYQAKGHYSMFYSCNTWANNALKHAGQKHCLWTQLADPILKIYYLEPLLSLTQLSDIV